MNKKNGVHYRVWKAKKPKAVVLAVHGMGGHSERYSDMAKFLAAGGISVYAPALRGYGEFKNDLKNQNMREFIRDVIKLKQSAEKENPGKPVFILGESMGAVISHTLLLKYGSVFSGIIEIVPVWKDTMLSPLQSLGIIITSVFSPLKNISMPFSTKDLTSDKKITEKMEKDEREVKTATAKLLVDMGICQIEAAMNPKAVKIPVLMLLAGRDTMGSNKASISLFNRMKTDKKLIVYSEMLHALTIEKGRKKVFKDIYNFINRISKK